MQFHVPGSHYQTYVGYSNSSSSCAVIVICSIRMVGGVMNIENVKTNLQFVFVKANEPPTLVTTVTVHQLILCCCCCAYMRFY